MRTASEPGISQSAPLGMNGAAGTCGGCARLVHVIGTRGTRGWHDSARHAFCPSKIDGTCFSALKFFKCTEWGAMKGARSRRKGRAKKAGEKKAGLRRPNSSSQSEGLAARARGAVWCVDVVVVLLKALLKANMSNSGGF